MSLRVNFPREEFIKMWYDDSIGVTYMVKHFNVSAATVRSFAKRSKLGKKNEHREVIEGGLPDKPSARGYLGTGDKLIGV